MNKFAHRKPGFRGLGTISGSALGKIARKTYVCQGCGLQAGGVQVGKKVGAPPQCASCGRMDFYSFDSLGEASRWAALLLKVRAGLISDLRRQVRYSLNAARADGTVCKVGEYIADFVYQRDGATVIEDFKGAITDIAQWKLRHMAAQGLPVQIVTSKGVHNG